jgi:hypothetical protein
MEAEGYDHVQPLEPVSSRGSHWVSEHLGFNVVESSCSEKLKVLGLAGSPSLNVNVAERASLASGD